MMFIKKILSRKMLIGLVLLCAFTFCCFSNIAFAEQFSVSATVPSQVSIIKSTVEQSATESISDPVNHFVLLTVALRDIDGNPLSDIYVEITSNRGEIDIISLVQGQAVQDGVKKGKTDINGKAYFRLASYTPGEAVFAVFVDNLFNLTPANVKFLPLPFPTDVEISVDVPLTKKKIVIVPSAEAESKTEAQQKAKKLANTGTIIKLPFWLVLIVTILIVSSPIFLILTLISTIKLRRLSKKELGLLQQIEKNEEKIITGI